MFEGNLSSVVAGQTGDVGALRAVAWSELAAKLAAARDLRASLEGSEASFDAGSARRIAAHHNGKSSINPDDLGNGKGPEGIANPAVHGAATGVART